TGGRLIAADPDGVGKAARGDWPSSPPAPIFFRLALDAGAAGFFTLIQSEHLLGPGRYFESTRFETMPSQPSAQACAKTVAPSDIARLRSIQIDPRRSP